MAALQAEICRFAETTGRVRKLSCSPWRHNYLIENLLGR